MAEPETYVDSKAIEQKAIIEVIRYFEDSRTVATYLNDNDKEPFYDGSLYLYRGLRRDNPHYIGRVAVQVKGEYLGEFKDGIYSYPVEMDAIRAYLHEGIAYFVVQEVKRKKRIFYRLLTPIELRSIIDEKGEQGTYSIRLRRARDKDIKDIEAELIQFERDCNRQVSFVDNKPIEFEDLEKMKIHQFSVDVTVKSKRVNIFQAITEKPLFIYANVHDDLKVPIGTGRASIALIKDVNLPVVVNGKTFFDHYRSKMENGKQTIIVGDCFTLQFDPNDRKRQATLNIRRSSKLLKDVINEAEFLIELQAAKELTIGKQKLPIPFPDEHEMMIGLPERLKAWHELDDTLRMIGTNMDMDMSLVNRKDETAIETIIDMVYHGNARTLKRATIGINNVSIANLHLWLLVYKNNDGKYEIKNLFDKSLGFKATYQYPEGKFEESMYSGFNRERLMACDNFPYDDVIPSYEALREVNPHIYERGNLFLMELISAYDKTADEEKRKTMYEAALKIADWLIQNDKEDNALQNLINKYQLLKRNPGLTDEEKKQLKCLQLENTAGDEYSYAIALLLDDKDTYEYYWDKMNEETKKVFRDILPIYKFHDNN